MGLGFCVENDDYKCEAHWSYSGFKRFREKIAKHLNLILELDKEFNWLEKNCSGWDRGWLLFLTHSDCKGVLTSEACRIIAPKLHVVLQEMEENPSNEMNYFYDIENGKELIKAMRYCDKNNKKLIFC